MLRYSFLFLWLILWISCQPINTSKQMQTLHDDWKFSQTESSEWKSATVPGVVHLDLLSNGDIEDPFYGLNEKQQQWIGESDWIYQTTFTPNRDLFSKSHIVLVFEGLDTYADVYLNDKKVLTANNMFCRWKVPVKEYLVQGANTLRVEFQSAIAATLPLYQASPYQLPASNDQAEEKVSIYSRKAPYHFGWDWGPRFVTAGIWRPVRLEGWDDLSIENIQIVQESLSDQAASLKAILNLQVSLSGTYEMTVSHAGQTLSTETITIQAGEQVVTLPIAIENPQRWWPAGLGDQYLYDLKFEISRNGQTVDFGNERIGLRTVEFVHEMDEEGKSFYFKINDQPVFMKGANYIPSDNFLTRVDEDRYEYLLQSTIDANMNMLRIWGGGIYENDIFYDLCDEKGILVWEDFMFACSMYPTNEDFFDNVRQEAIDNIIRLRNHPSIVIWCGNNEIETAWNDWGWQARYSEEEAAEIYDGYDRMFHQLLPDLVAEYDPSRPYIASSPSANSSTIKANTLGYGDMHYWGVWHAAAPYESFDTNISRFMSEYGMQSFPLLLSVKKYTTPEDWDITSEVMLSHQRHPRGNQLIKTYMEREYQVPEDFSDFLFMSQVQQAEIIKYAVESHRSAMPYCMGSLYWQLNDCWPVASWSGIDYYGKWKAMHHYAVDFFAPVLPVIRENDSTVQIFGVSDQLNDEVYTLKTEFITPEGESVFSESKNITLPANTSTLITTLDTSKLLPNKNMEEVVLVTTLMDQDQVISRNIHLFGRWKDISLPDQEVKYAFDGSVLTVTAPTLQQGVYLELEGIDADFRPNFFTLLPGESREIAIETENTLTEADISDNLTIRSVNAVLKKLKEARKVQ